MIVIIGGWIKRLRFLNENGVMLLCTKVVYSEVKVKYNFVEMDIVV